MTSVTLHCRCWGVISPLNVHLLNRSGARQERGRKVVANVSEAAKGTVADVSKNRKGYTDVQGAPRFPIKLPVALKSAVDPAGITEKTVETENISANGVSFRMDADVPVGSAVDFTISLPADVVGAEADVQVDCRGTSGTQFCRWRPAWGRCGD